MTDCISIEDRLRAKAETLTEGVMAEVKRAKAVFIEEEMPGLVDAVNSYIENEVPTMPAVNGVGYHLYFKWTRKCVIPQVYVTYHPDEVNSDGLEEAIKDSVKLLGERLQESGVTAEVVCNSVRDPDSLRGMIDFIYER